MFGIKKKAAAETPATVAPTASPQPSSAAGDYAGFWLRFLAVFADGAMLFSATFVIAVVTSFAGEIGAMVGGGIIVLLNILYWTVMHATQRQATFGKAMVGIIVTDKDGNRISILRSLGRELAKIISMLPLGIGFLIAAFTGKKQALHDMIASTVVVRDGDAHIARTIVVTVVGYAVPMIAIPLLGIAMFAGIAASVLGDMAGDMNKGAQKPPAASAKPAAPKPAAPPAAPAGATPAAGTPGAPAATPAGAADKSAAAKTVAAPASPQAAPTPAPTTTGIAPKASADPVQLPAPKITLPPDEPEVKAPRRRAPRPPSAPAEAAAPKAPTAEQAPIAAAAPPAPAPKPCAYKPVMTDEEIDACRRR